MNIDLLQNFDGVILDPFPHLIIKDALPEEVYEELENTIPEDEIKNNAIFNKSANMYRYKCAQALNKERLPSLWKKFFEYHTSKKFFSNSISLFKKQFISIHDISSYMDILNSKIGIRNFDDVGTNYYTDCQYAINNPMSDGETHLLQHVDSSQEIYAGLLYMRKDEDKSSGGGLLIYDKEEVVKTIPYRRNVFVMFLNTGVSSHGVEPRIGAEIKRYTINIIGEFNINTNYRRMY